MRYKSSRCAASAASIAAAMIRSMRAPPIRLIVKVVYCFLFSWSVPGVTYLTSVLVEVIRRP